MHINILSGFVLSIWLFIIIIIIVYWWWFLVFSTTLSNISAKSWRPVVVVEEAGEPGENHQPWTSNCMVNFISLAAASGVHLFCNLQSRVRAHAVLVIGLYELLGNPTTQLIEPTGPYYLLNSAYNSNNIQCSIHHIIFEISCVYKC